MSNSAGPLFVDHSDLTALSQALKDNSGQRSTQQHEQRFWASAVAHADNPVQEVMDITLTSPRLINVMSFDTARFPHEIRVQYFDGARWHNLIDRDMGTPLAISIFQSVPAALAKATAVPGHLHPQHSYAGHWESISFRIQPITVQRIRLVLKRSTMGIPPVDVGGFPVPYSLAIMNLQLGYKIASLADVPRTAIRAGALNVRDPFATTDDILGSSVDYSLRTNDASSTLVEGDQAPIWRSEPQPYPHAVVNFYADLRNQLGEPQIIDRIYIDPIRNGSHISLYYSNDLPAGGFDSPSEVLTSSQASLGGGAAIAQGRLALGSYGQDAEVIVDNAAVGLDPALPWWIGIACQPNYGQAVDSNEHPLLETGAFRLSLTSVGILLRTNSGDLLEMPFSYLGRQEIRLIASYDGATLRLRARGTADDQEQRLTLSQPLPSFPVSQIFIGSDGGSLFGNADIKHLVIKEEVLPSDEFLDEPTLYSTVSEFIDTDHPSATRNTLLRFDPANRLIDAAHPSGLFAGVGQKYDSMLWAPVARDYAMERGWMQLPSIRARFVKLEITNLQPEYRDVHIPVGQQVKTFPADVLADYRASQAGSDRSPADREIGAVTQQNMANGLPYADYPIYVSTGGTQKGYTNTQAYVANDYNTAQRLYATMGPDWAYQNWHTPTTAPRFTKTCVHRYAVEAIAQSTKIAYFTGLRSIRFARSIFTGADDSGQYEDVLQDTSTISSSNWIHDAEAESLTSGNAEKAVATSIAYGSGRSVRGLQFAAQQSEPRRMLPDPDFADPQSRNWAFVGDASSGSAGARTAPLIGTVLEVSRAASLGLWEDIKPTYPTWGVIRTSGVTYGQLLNPARQVQTIGGVTSLPLDQPSGGRLYAAARVFANRDLSSPLWVQIVDAVTNVVLAEEPAVVKRDQVTEWSVSYSVGEGGGRHRNSWGSLVGPKGNFWTGFADSFARPAASSLGRMDSGQVWRAAGTGSLVLANSKATVTAIGQSSSVDTATPWGTLSVQLGNTVTAASAAASVLLLDLGSYQLFNDGRIVSKTTNHAPQTITLASNDSLKFEFVLTKSLSASRTPANTVAELTPYALVITRNGSYVATVISARAPSARRAIAGATGQTWSSFTWTPNYAEVPPGTSVNAMPMPGNGALAGDSGSWIDSAGGNWPIDGIWGFTSRASYQSSVPVASAASAGCGVYRDFGQDYGSLVFNVTQLASGVDPTTYFLATLDLQADASLLLRADGALVRADGTILKTGALPAPTASTTTIRFIKTSLLSAAFRTSRSISLSDEQTIIFLQNNSVISTVSGNGLWSGTVRGINGYSDSAGHFTVTEGFGWFSEGAYLATDTRRPSWKDVSRGGTYRYRDLSGANSVNANPICVRVVQKAASSDSWFMDTVDLFHDPISWEFSNDGGKTFAAAVDIRNNPHGVLLFDKPDLTNSANPSQNQLVWRVTAWGPGAWVSHLVIRPWYEGVTQGIPVRSAQSQQGPNLNPWDHYSPVEQDPRFRVWNSPIPRDWWFAYRDLDPTRISDITTQWLTLTLGDALVLED